MAKLAFQTLKTLYYAIWQIFFPLTKVFQAPLAYDIHWFMIFGLVALCLLGENDSEKKCHSFVPPRNALWHNGTGHETSWREISRCPGCCCTGVCGSRGITGVSPMKQIWNSFLKKFLGILQDFVIWTRIAPIKKSNEIWKIRKDFVIRRSQEIRKVFMLAFYVVSSISSYPTNRTCFPDCQPMQKAGWMESMLAFEYQQFVLFLIVLQACRYDCCAYDIWFDL